MSEPEDWVYPGPGNCDMCGHKEHEPSVCGVINGGYTEPEYCACIDAFRADAEMTRLRSALAEIESDDPPDSEDRWITVVRLMQIARTALEHDLPVVQMDGFISQSLAQMLGPKGEK